MARVATLTVLLVPILSVPHLSAQPPPAPTGLVAIPNYGGGAVPRQIELSWNTNSPSPEELRYQIFRKEDAGPWLQYSTLPEGDSTWVNVSIHVGREYLYTVRAWRPPLPGNVSAFSDTVHQNVNTVWPVPNSHEMLHSWNEMIGWAGQWQSGFHMGTDIQRAGQDTIVAIRGGVVRTVGAPPNEGVIIVVKFGDSSLPDSLDGYETNHVQNILPAANDVVAAGEPVALISQGINWNGAFPHGPHFCDHTHFDIFRTVDPFNIWTHHPLTIFSVPGDRDPGQTPPRILAHSPTVSEWLFKRDAVATPDYLVPGTQTAIDEDVDIIAEVSDEMGTNPDVIPTKVAYYIEPPTQVNQDCPDFHGVKDAARPYVLFEWEDTFFGLEPNPFSLGRAIAETNQNYGAQIDSFPWPNYKHVFLTHTKDTTGVASDVDSLQYWNTDALDDGAPADTAYANYAGRANAGNAFEARFPDGNYRVHVFGSDLEHTDVHLGEYTIRVENFPPVVCNAAPTEVFPCRTRDAWGWVTFNEWMDASVDPLAILSVDNDAVIQNAIWSGLQQLVFQITGLRDGEVYEITVAATAMDLPGTPGGRPLDGNGDGTGGDPYRYTFSVADCGNNNNNGGGGLSNNNNNGNGNRNGNNNNGNNNNGNGNGNGNGNNNAGGTEPVAVFPWLMLLRLSADTASEGGIEFTWSTGAEPRTNGFNVYRSPPGEARRTKLNLILIPGRGSYSEGGAYRHVDRPPMPNVTYHYWLEEIALDGSARLYGPTPGIWQLRFTLRPAYPTPTKQTAAIRYELPVETHVTLKVYDIRGRLVRRLVDARMPIGAHTAIWDGRNENLALMPSGVYLVRMSADSFNAAKKLILLR